jgi:hypothetical protein
MTKPTITKLFVGSLLAIGGGLVVTLVAGLAAVANGTYIMNGPDIVGMQESGLGWAMVAIAVIGVLVMSAAAIVQFVAWIGAVINTARLEDKTWFLVLLLLGLFSFGFIAMLVYVIAGPDGTQTATIQRGFPARPATSA